MGAPRGAEGRHSRAGRRRVRMVPVPSAPPRLLLLPNALLGRPAIEAEASPALPPSPSPSQPPRKRQRLAHLSPEEKALRRKLKNRVAAQSARDRKKARMGELERQAIELEAQNQRLSEENRLLREEAQGLAAENQELRLRLAGLHPSGAARGGAIVAASIKEEGEGGGASSPAGPAESAEGTGPAPGDTRPPQGHSTPPPPPPLDTIMDDSGAEPGVLLGLLEGLDPALFLLEQEGEEQEEEVLLHGGVGGRPFCAVRGPALPAVGSPERGLEAPDGPPSAARSDNDHQYTKPLPDEDEDVVATAMKREDEEAEFPLPSPLSSFFEMEAGDEMMMRMMATTMMKREEEEAELLSTSFLEATGSDAESDLEGSSSSSSPFADFAAAWELFPQLISV